MVTVICEVVILVIYVYGPPCTSYLLTTTHIIRVSLRPCVVPLHVLITLQGGGFILFPRSCRVVFMLWVILTRSLDDA